MSRRVKQEDPFSDFPTPGWCTDRLIDRLLGDPYLLPRGGRWLEPTAGAGGIIARFKATDAFVQVEWSAWEIQRCYEQQLQGEVSGRATIGDARELARRRARVGDRFDVAITNPPYPQAFELLKLLRPIARFVVMLLRVNFLSSEERYPYWAGGGMPKEILQLPNRPKFRNGASDSTEYGWFVWDGEQRVDAKISLLGLTPLAERKRWEDGR